MEIARKLGARAKTLVLVARRQARLEELSAELKKANPSLRVEILPCDLGNRAQANELALEIGRRGVDVDVLVNNAGVGLMGVFDRADPARVLSMLDLNVVSLTLLTAALLPPMVARGRGGILNISSGFGVAVLPSFAAYIATKHYVTGFTEALLADLTGTGVRVTQVCPGPVATEFEERIGNFTGMKSPAFLEISAEHCARAAINGFDRGRAMVVPGFMMRVLLAVNAMAPRFMRRLFASLFGRAIRKKEAGTGQGATT
jgi:short-subunit dehydrogenase